MVVLYLSKYPWLTRYHTRVLFNPLHNFFVRYRRLPPGGNTVVLHLSKISMVDEVSYAGALQPTPHFFRSLSTMSIHIFVPRVGKQGDDKGQRRHAHTHETDDRDMVTSLVYQPYAA